MERMHSYCLLPFLPIRATISVCLLLRATALAPYLLQPRPRDSLPRTVILSEDLFFVLHDSSTELQQRTAQVLEMGG